MATSCGFKSLHPHQSGHRFEDIVKSVSAFLNYNDLRCGSMERGTDIFGKAYGIMLRNDLHADGSVDRRLMQEMILIDESSADYLYGCVPEAKI